MSKDKDKYPEEVRLIYRNKWGKTDDPPLMKVLPARLTTTQVVVLENGEETRYSRRNGKEIGNNRSGYSYDGWRVMDEDLEKLRTVLSSNTEKKEDLVDLYYFTRLEYRSHVDVYVEKARRTKKRYYPVESPSFHGSAESYYDLENPMVAESFEVLCEKIRQSLDHMNNMAETIWKNKVKQVKALNNSLELYVRGDRKPQTRPNAPTFLGQEIKLD